jgi:hypothetical protein
MERKRFARILGLSVLGMLIAVGTGFAYHTLLAPWRGDVREPLIAAFFVGVAYFIFTLLGLKWSERREALVQRDQQD